MASGKTTLGPLVARAEGVPFVDLDAAVEEAAGDSIERIFATQGEAAFRALEASELRRLLAAPEPRVIAVGGGALVATELRRFALENARVVTLVARPETLLRRVEAAGVVRPLLADAPDKKARIAELLALRDDAYAEAHAKLRTDSEAPDALVNALRRIWREDAVLLPLGARSYAVRITHRPAEVVAEMVDALGPSSIFLVTDTQVAAAVERDLEHGLGPRGRAFRSTVAFAPGEENKHLGSIELALTTMVEASADRDALVVAQGGGVVTDMGGFTAATLLRGVRWVAVPTTLLSMVDASVGGKTGVDLGVAKNAVGAFHQPSAVVIGPGYVRTEPQRGYLSGLAEAVKTAAIGDPELLTWMEEHVGPILARDPEAVEHVVSRSVAVKAGVVSRDERESGERAFLNFGHTVGHALESHGGYQRLTHGEAVSLGMVAILSLGVLRGVTPPAVAKRVVALLQRLGLPTDLAGEPLADAIDLIGLDKKRRGGKVRAVLLADLGRPELHPLAVDAFRALVDKSPQL